jgi:hypothetical protein
MLAAALLACGEAESESAGETPAPSEQGTSVRSAPPQTLPPDSPLRLTLDVSREVGERESVPLLLVAENHGSEEIVLPLDGNPAYDFYAEQGGEVVWRWFAEGAIQDIEGREVLQPGEEIRFSTAEWDQEPSFPGSLTSGEYELYGVLRILENNNVNSLATESVPITISE